MGIYTIRKWDVFGDGELRVDDFLVLGGMLMEHRKEAGLGHPFTLIWCDADANPCSIQDISLGGPVLVTVHLGSRDVSCEAVVTLDTADGKTTVTGSLKAKNATDGGDGNAGIFIADASAPPPPVLPGKP